MPLSRLALRVAAVVGGGVAVVEGLRAAAAPADGAWAGEAWAEGAVVALGAAVLAYAAVARFTGARLRQARARLDALAEHRPALRAPATSAPAALASAGASADELGALVRDLDRAGQALEDEIAALRSSENYRREFLGNVSHELRTPIFAIQGFAETLLDGALDDPDVRQRFVEKILRNVTRLQTLTRDLTELARLESGELRMVHAPVALAALAAEVVESVEGAAGGRGVTVEVEAPEGLPRAWGDRERLRQVLTNLVENAVKYNRPDGRVRVSLRADGPGRLAVAVADTGVGIEAAHLPRLTERFYRVDASRSREVGGTGLGLAIVKHILAAHGERLTVESTPGEGSTFGFGLPVAPAPEGAGPASRTATRR